MFFILGSCILWPDAIADPLFLVNFQAKFNGGFGFPGVSMAGSYEFELQPPIAIVNNGTTALYAMQSASIDLNGGAVSTTPSQIRVDNDLILNTPGFLRDGYFATALLSGTFMGDFALQGAGLDFEQGSAAPAAFNSLDLPTSVADLSGFGPSDLRSAFLVFEDLQQGGLFAINGDLEDLAISEVPEPPMAIPLCALGLGLVVWSQRHMARKCVS
ncbi:MAG: hypothetical protein LAP38_27035 [Acidobacteriia bacterium]|nr:hypothetical protein [Terriglobia bacterium]